MEQRDTVKRVLSSEEGIGVVKRLLSEDRDVGRVALARRVCGELSLRDWRGEVQWSSCLKALRELEVKGTVELPAGGGQGGRWSPRRLGGPVEEPKGVPERVDQIRRLELLLVRHEDPAMLIWNELISGEHELHSCRLVGRQVRYLIGSEHGYLALWPSGRRRSSCGREMSSSAGRRSRGVGDWNGW